MEYSSSISTVDNFFKSDQQLNNLAGEESTDITMNKRTCIRKMYLAALSSLLLAVSMGLATGYSAPATYDMDYRNSSSVKPTANEITWIGSILALGAMIGGIFAGPLADRIGRKDTLIFNVIPFVSGWLLICYAKTVSIIIFGRFLCGLSCGVISVTVPMYCVEISTADVRGILGSSFQGFMVIGNLLSVIIGSYVTWKELALHGAIFVTFGVVCCCFIPESPRWLLVKGRLKEAKEAMHKLQGDYVDVEKECNAIYRELKNQPKGKLSIGECRHPTVYKPALISFVLMFFQQASGSNAVLFYSSRIFKISKDFMDPRASTIVLGAVQVVATLSSNLIVDKAGRKILLLLSAIFMSLSLILLGTYYYMSSDDTHFQTKYSWIPLISLISFVIAFSIGFGAIPWLLAAEMVPVRARSTVGGLATFSNGIFAFIITKTFSELEDLIHSYGAFWFYSSISLLAAVFVFYVVPETKGKRLEDIENIFYKKRPQQNISISHIS